MATTAARSAVTVAIEGFNNASKVFDASFEALAEPSRRTLLRSSELFPWQSWYGAAWTNITKGEDNLFADAEKKRTSSAPESPLADLTTPPHDDDDDDDDHHHHHHHHLDQRGSRGGSAGDKGEVVVEIPRAEGGVAPEGEGVGVPPAWSGRRYSVKRWRPEPVVECPE
ncbi:unnamed protein product, partial [Hapterophycus canaliculatus]